MKQRFSALDIAALSAEVRSKLVGLRLQNVYDLNNKTYLFKFSKADVKELFLVESGIRMHVTKYAREKSNTPSAFAMKLRKHLRTRRCSSFEQLGIDRIIDMKFGENETANHVIIEFYASGNIILTDHEYRILSLLRVVDLDKASDGKEEGEDATKSKMQKKAEFEASSDSVQFKSLLDAFGEGDELFKSFVGKPQKGFVLFENVGAVKPVSSSEERPEAVGGDSWIQSDFYQHRFAQISELPVELKADPNTVVDGSQKQKLVEFASFNDAVDEFFSHIEHQRLQLAARRAELAAQRKLEAVKAGHENHVRGLEVAQETSMRQAQAIEANLQLVDAVILATRSYLATGMDWIDFAQMLKDEQKRGNQLARVITGLKLEIGMLISVDIDIYNSAYGNARRYYESKKTAESKQAKTLQVVSKAMKLAEKKIQEELRHTDRKQEQANLMLTAKIRKPYWFEKFLWFISSENYLVVGGRDAQQNEILVRRYLKKGDVYVHADLHGAASVIVINTSDQSRESVGTSDDECTIPPTTLLQAGSMSVCQSKAWEAKIVTSAWWVHSHQVSKTAPTGEYLGTGSFMIRGKKNFLPPVPLVYGFGIIIIPGSLLDSAQDYTYSYLDLLTGAPTIRDTILNAIPVCGPWSAMQRYKYKAKLVPGALKRGKAAKTIQAAFLAMAGAEAQKETDEQARGFAGTQRNLIRVVPENDMILACLGKVKVVVGEEGKSGSNSKGGKSKGKH
ncbi:hypothetical protein BJ742DRAFT_672012 [Cladochytrium replicatum]|nr:hypothetical protein BJ742DRAFT_672012 [Cladochytrium replicatum]